jgi:hypothetical protein
MANLLKIKKRVVSTRAPRIPTIAPDAKPSDKLKKAFGYFEKISDISIEDIFESAKRLGIAKEDAEFVKVNELSEAEQLFAFSISKYTLSKKAYMNLNMEEVYTCLNPKNNQMIVILNWGITTKMGLKWYRRSPQCTYEKGVCYSGPYLVFIDHLLDACGHYGLSKEERDAYQESFGWRYGDDGDDILIQALLYGGCYKKDLNLLNASPVEKVEHKCMAFLRQEANVQANKRFENLSQKVIATVTDDKKYQDSALNRSTRFNSLGFRKVEVDTAPYRFDISNGAKLPSYKTFAFDYNEFRNVEAAWEKIVDRLPQGTVSPELKFRKLGKHKATGLYHPMFNIIAVDVRDTTSFIHEFGHYLDFTYLGGEEECSLQDDFADILASYQDTLPKDISKCAYFKTPTEVFARGFELWVFETLISDSPLLQDKRAYYGDPEYLAFKNCKKELINYYNNLFGKITTHLAASLSKSEAQKNTHSYNPMIENIATSGEQLCLF